MTLPTSSPEVLHVPRALEVLELVGTAGARPALKAVQRRVGPDRVDKEVSRS